MGGPSDLMAAAAKALGNIRPAVPAKVPTVIDVADDPPPVVTPPPAGGAPPDPAAAPPTAAASTTTTEKPPPPSPPPEPAPASAAPALADLEKQRDDLVAKRTKLQRFLKDGGDDLPLGQTISDIKLAREQSSQRQGEAKEELKGLSAELLDVLGLIADASGKLGPVPSALPEVAPLDKPPDAMDERTAEDRRRRIREAETGRRELPSLAPSVMGRAQRRMQPGEVSVTEPHTGQTFTEAADIDPWFRPRLPYFPAGPLSGFVHAPPGETKPVLGQTLGESIGGFAGLPRKMWEDPSGVLTFPFLGSSAAEKSYRMKHGEPMRVQNPSTGRTETMPFATPLARLEMEKLGLDPANPEDRRKWEEELDPSLVPGGGRDPQMETIVEDPLVGQQWGYDRYSDEAYQKAMGSGLMKTATGERPKVRDMSDVPMEERRSHFEGLSLDDRADQARGEFLGAQMVLTEIDAEIKAAEEAGRSTQRSTHLYQLLQAKKSVTEDFVHQAKAILNQLRRQQYRRAMQAKRDRESNEQF